MQAPTTRGRAPADSDDVLHAAGYIVIVPMIADEHDDAALGRLKGRVCELPGWPNRGSK
jgi:hypothetical protein